MKNFIVDKKSLLRKSIAIFSLGVLAAPAFALSPPANSFWKVQDGKLLDPNGNPFVFRGVTINHTLAPKKTLQALKDAAAMGANSAQIEFAILGDGTWPRAFVAELREIIQACKDNKLVCVLEPNDGSGYSQAYGSRSPSEMASYWAWNDLREVLNGAHHHIIIGLSNQIFDSNYAAGEYVMRMQSYLGEFRSSVPGFMIMIDGNKWGQDSDKAMLQLATSNRQIGGSYANIIYSVDMFDAYQDPASARDYIASFAQLGAPLLVGGFAPVPYYHPYNQAARPTVAINLPAQAVMQYAEQYGAGYFGWSWSGNESSGLDVVTNYDANQLTAWGNLLFNDANGIKATARLASIYSNNSSSTSSSSVSANQPPVPKFDAYNYPTTFCNGLEAVGKITATGDASFDPEGDAFTCSWSIGSGTSTSAAASACSASFPSQNRMSYQLTLTVTDSKGASAVLTKTVAPFYVDCPSSSSRSSSSVRSSSSIPDASRPSTSSSSVRSSSSSSVRTSSSSSVPQTTKAQCSYVINSQWNNGFTAAIRIKNTTTTAINSWDVNWQYSDGSKVTNLWNATLNGSNPYNAKNLSWNSTIQPGQTVEFGFQGSKSAAPASVPAVTGSICQ